VNASVAFDRAADYYDQTRGFPPGEERAVASIIAHAGEFHKTSRVLEIGVGTGRIALPLSDYVNRYIGLDLSRPMMNKLREKQNGEPIFLTEGDATRLPFPSQAFDGAAVVHVFHLIPNWREALAELKRVLRPGAMVVHCWSKDSHSDVFKPLWDAWNAAIGEKAAQNVGAPWRENPDFLADEGWVPVRQAVTHEYAAQTTLNQFFDLLGRRVWSSCWRYDDEELARGMAAMKAIAPQHFPDPDAPIHRTTTVYARGYLPPGSP
jgi:ubiquinone/menaquinone biosynthesis C-methylase UbiE